MHTLTNCQICGGSSFKKFNTCIDYTVSNEKFDIVECNQCKFKFTNPIPDLGVIGNYYKSNNYISHSNTSKGFVNSVYQFVRKFTLVKKLQLINSLTKKASAKHLLDIGCGTGEFLNTCNNAGWLVQGIEPDDDTRNFAKSNYKLTVNDEEYLQTAFDKSIDCVTMWHVLEHVPDLNNRLKSIFRVLKDDGVLVIAVPNCTSYDAVYYAEYWGAYDVPRHLHHFTPNDIETLVKNNGFYLERVLPMVFDSFYVSLLSEKYKTGKTNLISGFFRGLVSNLKAAIKNNNSYSSQIYIVRKS